VEERDISQSYMEKEEGVSDITVRGGRDLTFPFYCLGCQLGGDKALNLSQMLDHVVLVHQEREDRVLESGVTRLRRYNKAYKAYQASRDKERKQRVS